MVEKSISNAELVENQNLNFTVWRNYIKSRIKADPNTSECKNELSNVNCENLIIISSAFTNKYHLGHARSASQNTIPRNGMDCKVNETWEIIKI